MVAPNASYFTPKGSTLQWITNLHRALYRGTRGLIGHTVFQRAETGAGWLLRPMKVLLLTTVGRKSGQARTVPLPYFEYDGRRIIVGSFAGGARHPAWFHNLRATPEVELQVGWRSLRARGVVLQGDDRDRMWQRLVADWPRYQLYQDGTDRTIPLVELVSVTGP